MFKLSKLAAIAAVSLAACISLTGCTAGNEDGTRMLQIYVSPDLTNYVDITATTKGKDTVIVDDATHLRVMTESASNCAKHVERILTDETNVYVIFDASKLTAEECSSTDKRVTVEKITSVSNGNFEEAKNFFFCTTDSDCKKSENTIFARQV